MGRKLLLSLLSVVLLSVGWLEVTGITLLVAFIPLLIIGDHYTASRGDMWRMFGWVALTFAIWSGWTTWWIWYAAPIGAILSVLITVGLFGGVFMLFHWTKNRVNNRIVPYTLLISAWIAAEYLYTVGEVSFPWLMLGNGFANDIMLVQWYDTTGMFGGSLWVLGANILLFEAIKARSRWWWITAAIVVLLPIGISLLKFYTYKEGEQRVKIAVVQPNIEPYYEKFVLSQQVQTDIILGLAAEAPSDVDYIVMPETAIDEGIWEDKVESYPAIEQIRELIERKYQKTQLIVGATTYRQYYDPEQRSTTARGGEDGEFWYDVYNTALVLDGSKGVATHHKSVLVVGVEKMPYYWLLKHLEFLIVDLGGTTGQMGVDSEQAVFDHPKGMKSAVAICYESVYGEYFSEFVNRGAQVMFIITNDGWWGNTAGHRQHFSFSKLRAIESRRSIARSANTGISGFVNQRGETLARMDWEKTGILIEELSLSSKTTFYTKYGDYIARLCCLVFGLSLLYTIVYRVKKINRLIDEEL